MLILEKTTETQTMCKRGNDSSEKRQFQCNGSAVEGEGGKECRGGKKKGRRKKEEKRKRRRWDFIHMGKCQSLLHQKAQPPPRIALLPPLLNGCIFF